MRSSYAVPVILTCVAFGAVYLASGRERPSDVIGYGTTDGSSFCARSVDTIKLGFWNQDETEPNSDVQDATYRAVRQWFSSIPAKKIIELPAKKGRQQCAAPFSPHENSEMTLLIIENAPYIYLTAWFYNGDVPGLCEASTPESLFIPSYRQARIGEILSVKDSSLNDGTRFILIKNDLALIEMQRNLPRIVDPLCKSGHRMRASYNVPATSYIKKRIHSPRL